MLRLRGREFRWGERTYVMAIVNVTPDSFSGDGLTDPLQASEHAVRQAQDADVIDIGAESTRPGYTAVTAEIEMQRLIPAIREVRRRLPDCVISADTAKAAVFRAAHEAGADILNSVCGLPNALLEVVAERGAPVVVTHNAPARERQGRVMDDVLRFLAAAAERAMRAGIPRGSIMLDPGIGFGKTADENIEILRNLRRLPELGFPTLVGTSRKSTIGRLTGRPADQRVAGTTATTALAVQAGIDMVRVHDVPAALDAVRVADAVVRGWRPPDWIE